MSKESRCTRNALYQHDCVGRDDLEERQEHYIRARSEEEAWQIMATRYPEETTVGFTVEPWQGGKVMIVEIKRDEFGNIIE
jgi:hypothetical protein